MDDIIKNDIKIAVDVLKKGGIILYPTDTIWGLGCDATNPEAVAKIYKLKNRDDHKSMLVLLDDAGKIASYATVPDIALDLISVTDKPLTIIYPGAKYLAPNLIGEDKTIGIRITSENFSRELIYHFRRPIVSTSANISGEESPKTFADISDEIKAGVDYVVNYRQKDNTKHNASSIIKIGERGEITIIRK